MNNRLKELADTAADAVSDLLQGEWADWFDGLSDLEKIQWRYCHADCDDFAAVLNKVTGFPVVGLSNHKVGPLHRLVQADDGRLLDAHGWVDVPALSKRYRVRGIDKTVLPQRSKQSIELELDDVLSDILETMLLLPVAPYTDTEFRSKVLAYGASIGFTPVAVGGHHEN